MAAAPPWIPEELFEEILLRLPPDDPACLLRASLVCKAWGCAVSRPHFRRRLHELHRAPPVLGFLHVCDDDRVPHFTPTTASSFCLAAPDSRPWRALDCRHGRALFFSKGDPDPHELLLWEPTTGAQQRVPVPGAYDSMYRDADATVYGPVYATGAVLCAADGCDHRDCLGGPFRVVFVFALEEDNYDEEYGLSACVYSSETGAWGDLTSMYAKFSMDFMSLTYYYSSVLVGTSLLYFISDNGYILEYDLARHAVDVLDPPNYGPMYDGGYNIVLVEDGGLGVSQEMNPHLKLWTREVSDGTDARWVLSRVIYLENLLPNGALLGPASSLYVLGFAEGANVIFMTTVAGIFMIELQSERVRMVCGDHGLCNLIPIVSFYTPVPRGEQNDLSFEPSEEAGGPEGGGEEEKTVGQAHQLFDNGPNITWKGGFLNAFDHVSHTLGNRVPPNGEVTPESTDMGVVLYEAVTGPLGDVLKTAQMKNR